MSDLYPFAEHFFEINGQRMHYADEGSGEPVVMLHGNPTWSFYYRNLILPLHDSHRCIAPDHIGCGKSDKPNSKHYSYTLEQRAKDIESLLDHLQIRDNITLMLHDWGGMIGMLFAHWHPERIKRLVILNTAAFHLPESKPLPWQLRMCRNAALGPLLVRGLNLFCRSANRMCSVKGLSPEVKHMYLAPYNSWANRVAVLRFVQDIPLNPHDNGYDLVSAVEAGLHRFQNVPMLICWGAKDFVFDDHFLRIWQQQFPDAKVHRFEDAGHYVMEDKPGDIVELVTNFLAEPENNDGRLSE